MEHFKFFPSIEYSGYTSVNMLARAKLRDLIKEKVVLYYEHTVSDGQRADTISADYYGSSKYTWMIYYANDIVCPYEEWPLNSPQFKKLITRKYGSIQRAFNIIHHYTLDNKYIIDQNTYEDNSIEFFRKNIVTAYDHEFNINEQKRSIRVIDSIYLGQITSELRRLFK